LQAAGHDVVVYDNLRFGHREAVSTELVVADLSDSAALNTCMSRARFDAVMHFAAFIEAGESMENAAKFFENNTANAITLLNATARHGIGQLVFSSTAGVYGMPVEIPIKESDPAIPINVYAESKLLVERMLPWYELIHGVRSVALRYFNAAGAALDGSRGQDHQPPSHLLTVAIEAAMGRHQPFILFGDDYPTPDGTCIRDYIHVEDLATAHVVALEHLASGGTFEIFNVGAGKGHSNWDVINALKRISGVDFPIDIGSRRPGDPTALVADSTRLRSRLGWQPELSDLDTIVSSAWEWHQTHPNGYQS
jgi:UDP-glucose 4-epimerase